VDAELALEVRGARVRFGAVVPCDGVDIAVRPGEIVGIIGPNGAGKSTLLDAISGFAVLEQGSIAIGGSDVTRALPYRRARLGLARSFQDARLFMNMTVREALLGCLHGSFRGGLLAEGIGAAVARDDEQAATDAIDDALALVDVRRYLDVRIADLSVGTARAVELAVLSLRRPTVLLLDEPASGLQQSEVEVLAGVIQRIRGNAATLIVEHDVPFVRAFVDRLIAMDLGRVIADGPPAEVLDHPAVIESYLGVPAR
jgi:ABC-type branched-subunit amino acid transport system ATPase component